MSPRLLKDTTMLKSMLNTSHSIVKTNSMQQQHQLSRLFFSLHDQDVTRGVLNLLLLLILSIAALNPT